MNITKINVLIVAMLILCATLSMGCLEDKVYTNEFEFERLDLIENRTWQEEQRWNELKFEMLYPSEGERVSTKVPEFDIKVTRVYTDDIEWTTVVYSIENTGNVPVTWLEVSVYLLNADGDLIAVETRYPSSYPSYGLSPGQIIYNDELFRPEQGYGCASGGVKIVNYKVS